MLAMLELAGLSAEAESVYDAMLTGTPVTQAQLVKTTGLSQARIRIVLGELEPRGLVSRVPGNPSPYVAMDPSLVLDKLILQREEELKRARARVQELNERFHRMGSRRDPAELVEVVTGAEAIRQCGNQLQAGAHSLLRCLDKPPYYGGIQDPDPGELEYLKRGGIARGLYERESVDGRLPHIETAIKAGEQARVLPSLPAKLLLIDDRLAWLPLRPGSTGQPSPSFVLVHRSGLLDALSGLFETLWQVAVPVEVESSVLRARGEMAAHERRILALMNAGMPDEAIARQLGLSHRTLQRRIRDLMDRMHAETRYQLGVHVALRGGLPKKQLPLR